MIGIYKINNLINGKIYIGQSVNIFRRYQEHLRAGQPEKYSHKKDRDINLPIHKAMQKYGVQNFSLTILEECSKEKLDQKEKYWISFYHSNDSKTGYNLTAGGQDNFALKGEKHSQAKLSQKDVDLIKQLLLTTDKSLEQIRKRFPFISKSTISMINQGKIWHNEKEHYPIRQMSTSNKGIKNGRAKFTEEQVMEIRNLYSQGYKPKEIIQKYRHIASESAIFAILYGRTYKHLPIWKNKEKCWIKPCIDYPQSLK